jgi:hypothetical protein
MVVSDCHLKDLLMPKPIMRKKINQPLKAEEGFELKLRLRNSKPVILHIPADTLADGENTAQ